jgi:hypothetical protein
VSWKIGGAFVRCVSQLQNQRDYLLAFAGASMPN